ncbi:MAG: DUF4476 domain-containing protein [Bacteroidales bacterium]|nr:DUF4476 domain-containing protein [Bacteroidales bacterium]
MHQPMPVPTPAPGPIAMNEIDFQRALSVIKSEDFENTKLSTAKQVASNNLLTVNQISRICQLFEFDRNKKELDKFVQQQK